MPLSLTPLLTPLSTSEQSATVQSAPAQIEAKKSTAALPSDPLPADPLGQKLCEIFGRYLYCSIYADAPQSATEKTQWHTQRRYKLKNRILYRDWQDAENLIGVRPGHAISYALLDIDINSPYHPRQDAGAIAHIEAALETIGITRTLRIRSSWSEGIHLYLPLPEPVKTFDLAVALKNCLVPQGFKLKQGQLECFPNVKAYGNIIKTEYLAHRLPLQPASGSCLLDEASNPGSSKLSDFLNQWDITAAGQDIQTLQKALPLARKNRFKKVRNRLGKVEGWKRDLETVLAEGWSGPSQTNQLLKEFGCYGHVFLGHAGEELVDFIYQQAISSPGYKKWCRHQREIRMRSRVWATAIEKYYWPLGTYGTARQKTTNNIASFNDIKAQNAQANIKAAIQHLEAIEALPKQATARAHAIRKTQASLKVTSSSLETLYKAENKQLWHPAFYPGPLIDHKSLQPVINETTSLSDIENNVANPLLEESKPRENKRLRTKEKIMKCAFVKADVLASAKTKFSSEKGGAGGEKSFPQGEVHASPILKISNKKPPVLLELPDSLFNQLGSCSSSTKKPLLKSASIANDQLTNTRVKAKRPIPKRQRLHNSNTHSSKPNHKDNGIAKKTSETITAIQLAVQKLGWPIERVHNFIAQKFQGRRRAQLADSELIKLLYYLRSQCLELESV